MLVSGRLKGKHTLTMGLKDKSMRQRTRFYWVKL